MASFPSIQPTYGAAKSSSPQLVEIQMGDGYTQVLRFGLNQNPKVWSLRWEVSEADADTIETFLDARALDQASFTFTPPAESSSSQFVCESWSKTVPYLNRATINATFRQVFEPA